MSAKSYTSSRREGVLSEKEKMKEVRTTLIERIKRTESIESFRFKPEKKISFLPGQFLQLILDQQNKDSYLLNKYLSFSSAPNKDYIEVTKRITGSDFCNLLQEINIGNQVLIEAPMGDCSFKDSYAKIGFLIGGIGITPVISILEYIVERDLDTDVCLLYSNRSKDDIAFGHEIDIWSKGNLRIKVFHTITDQEPKDQRYDFGRIDKQFLMKNIPDFKERIFFIFGPPKMVSAMENICNEAGCSKEMIKAENFVGY